MLELLKKLIYPAVGLLILGGYVYTVRRGIEPFGVSSERAEVPRPSTHTAGNRYRRVPSVFWLGGLGGK